MRSSDSTESIKYKFTCSAEIPAQLVMTSAIKSMESAGTFTESSMNYLLYGNLGLQLFMSVSMQLLWGMVNTLQLVIHMNMLTVLIPANVQFFFSFIVNIVNFKVVPTDTIINTIFSFKEEFSSNSTAKGEVSPEFKSSGYTSTNLLRNLGLLFLAIMGVVLVIIIVKLLSYLKNRFSIVKQGVEFIEGKLFFNSLIRAFLVFGS